MIIIEEFKRSIPHEIKVHLNEQHVCKLSEAATKADAFASTHKSVFKKNVSFQTKTNHSGYQRPPQTESPSVKPQINESWKTGSLSERGELKGGKYCEKPGHVLEDCFSLQRKKERENKSNMLIVLASPQNTNCDGIDSECLNQSLSEQSSKVTDNCDKPFITRGKVNIPNASATEKKKYILGDTGASQTVLREGVLPVSDDTYTGVNILLETIGYTVHSVPLHKIHLSSDLGSDLVTVGITSALPLDDNSLLLGNDIAGERVILNSQPTVLCIPEAKIETEKIQDEFPNIFPACVVTRSMSKHNKNDNSISDNYDISGTFMTDLDSDCDLSSSNYDERVTQLNLQLNL